MNANRTINLDDEQGNYRGVYVIVVDDDSFFAQKVENWMDVLGDVEYMKEFLRGYNDVEDEDDEQVN